MSESTRANPNPGWIDHLQNHNRGGLRLMRDEIARATRAPCFLREHLTH